MRLQVDFKSFQAEIKKAFKAHIPLKQRNDWECAPLEIALLENSLAGQY